MYLFSIYLFCKCPTYLSYLVDLKPFYNRIQIFWNLVSVILIFREYHWISFGYNLNNVSSYDKSLLFLYFYNKIFDWVDTFMIIGKQSWRQLTVLHISHHVLIALTWYYILYFVESLPKECLVQPFFNSLIHVIMYLYYNNAEKLHKYKMIITITQLVQFCICFIHSIIVIYNGLILLGIIECLFSIYMFIMFGNFFMKNYLSKNTKEH